jgi:pimeloyl-ACP methyl ester carboxylesterase
MQPAEDLAHLRRAAQIAGLNPEGAALPESRHVVVDGFRLHLLDWGGSGPPLLLLHGGALTAHTWDLVCLVLRDRYHCIAVDQRGHGDSEWSPGLDYGSDAYVRDIEGLARELGLDRAVIVGQSLGAINGLTCAARRPDWLAGLVMVDAGPWVRPDGAQRIAEFVLAPAELPSVEHYVERAVSFNPRRDPELLRRSLLHNLRPLPGGGWTWKYDRRHLAEGSFERMRARLGELERMLDTVACPVLVVRGAESDVLSHDDAERLVTRLPDARLAEVAGAGHTVQGDNPRDLAHVVDEFAAALVA